MEELGELYVLCLGKVTSLTAGHQQVSLPNGAKFTAEVLPGRRRLATLEEEACKKPVAKRKVTSKLKPMADFLGML